MFTNIGRKIKTLAEVLCWLGIAASVIAGLGLARANSAIYVIIGGVLLSWVSSFALYGFGELIENTSIMKDQIEDIRRILSGKSDTTTSSNENDPYNTQPDTYRGFKL